MRPLPPRSLSVLCFTGIQSYSYKDQRKVEADVEVTEDRTGDLSLRKPRTSQLSNDCSLKEKYESKSLLVHLFSSHFNADSGPSKLSYTEDLPFHLTTVIISSSSFFFHTVNSIILGNRDALSNYLRLL